MYVVMYKRWVVCLETWQRSMWPTVNPSVVSEFVEYDETGACPMRDDDGELFRRVGATSELLLLLLVVVPVVLVVLPRPLQENNR
jgi:hypothetical protein